MKQSEPAATCPAAQPGGRSSGPRGAEAPAAPGSSASAPAGNLCRTCPSDAGWSRCTWQRDEDERAGEARGTHRWGCRAPGPGQPASPAPRGDHGVGGTPSIRARPGTQRGLGWHPPQPPGHHDGHAVAHGLCLGNGVGGQQGAARRISNGGPDQLPEERPRKINVS